MLDKLKKMIGAVAPTLGIALGGPVGGLAGKALSMALTGKDSASDKELTEAFQSATPETLLRLKEEDNRFRLDMERIGLSYEELAKLDRESARSREVKMAEAGARDYIVPCLALLVTLGFFSLLFTFFFVPVQEESRTVFDVMVGSLGTAWISIIGYYFGSSNGSEKKTKILESHVK